MIDRITKILDEKIFTVGLLAAAAMTLAFGAYWSVAPSDFPAKAVVSIAEGTTLSQTATELQRDGIIRSQFVYKAFVALLGGSKKILAGDYLFDSPQSALRVAYRTVTGDQDIPQVKVTVPEGLASSDIARLLEKKLPNFDSRAFLALAKPQEGRLFPDTYYIYETMSEKQIVEMMTANFDKQTKGILLSTGLFGRSFDDILKMASIVEKEAAKTEDRRIIAGILWKRMDDNYPLQVDAPFFYTLGKDSSELTMADLKSDSPYNLYTHKGLPPTPINNPGLDAIKDTINPIATDYWFYLSDSKGNMHYAATHDGHLANREKYLQ